MKKFSKHTKLLIALVLLLGAYLLIMPKISNGGANVGYVPPASSSSSGGYFGGKITAMVQCTCTPPSSQVTITGGMSSGTYLYTPGSSRLYKYGQIVSGKNVLGRYTSGGKCEVLEGDACIPYPITKGTITSIGTSR